jgi:hypothetical protein
VVVLTRLRYLSALVVAVSGGIHLRLYLDGYRDIRVDRLLGLDISRSFLATALVAASLAVFIAAYASTSSLATVGELAGIAYGAGTLAAYAATRTVGLLGFEDNEWSTEAIIAKTAEALLIVLCTTTLVWSRRLVRRPVTTRTEATGAFAR